MIELTALVLLAAVLFTALLAEMNERWWPVFALVALAAFAVVGYAAVTWTGPALVAFMR